MKASKIIHRGETRIKIEFPYNVEIAYLLRQIEGCKWSRTNRAWHIPYTKRSFNKLKSFFPDIEYLSKIAEIKVEKQVEKSYEIIVEKKEPLIIENITEKKLEKVEEIQKISAVNTSTKENLRKDIFIDVIGRQIFIRLPKNDSDVKFITLFKYSKWNKDKKCWIIPNYHGNIDLIRDYFNARIVKLNIHEQVDYKLNEEHVSIQKDEIIIIENQRRLKLLFNYSNEISILIGKFPYSVWDSKNKWWTVPSTDRIKQEIIEIANKYNLKYTFKEDTLSTETKLKRPLQKNAQGYLSCPQEFILKLQELRYSENTIKTYKNAFEEFINYYKRFDLNDIDEAMIINFLRYLVNQRKVSTSYQNQTINAIKFYYEKIKGEMRKVYSIDRPRLEKTLPIVLSKEEIISILNNVDNIKHKSLLMVAYSGGLRISEVVNLKVKDIDSARKQIRVEQAKGKKDRYTLLSDKLLVLLRKYYKEYEPKNWLFEGASGEKYSTTSIYNILKQALIKAKITKKVSMHTLRHSFATHLLENGTDLRYIQSLLGHENSKTTEIYTHITTRGMEKIKSPLDNLDI